MALEAEVVANAGNAEAWRLLGTVHAENDDDPQVWRCGKRAQTELEVWRLLGLVRAKSDDVCGGTC